MSLLNWWLCFWAKNGRDWYRERKKQTSLMICIYIYICVRVANCGYMMDMVVLQSWDWDSLEMMDIEKKQHENANSDGYTRIQLLTMIHLMCRASPLEIQCDHAIFVTCPHNISHEKCSSVTNTNLDGQYEKQAIEAIFSGKLPFCSTLRSGVFSRKMRKRNLEAVPLTMLCKGCESFLKFIGGCQRARIEMT